MVSERVLKQMQAANASRGAAVLAIVLDGLRAVVSNARAGDPDGLAAVKSIRALAREIEALASGIELPGPPPGQSGQ